MTGSKQHGHRAVERTFESGPAPRVGAPVIEKLIAGAWDNGLRAPELSAVLAQRAADCAEQSGAGELWVRAEALAVHAHVRLGNRVAIVERALTVLRAAESAGLADEAARTRIDLAVCARAAGAPLTGLAVLRPVLTDATLPPLIRASALVHLVGCLPRPGRRLELDQILVEADRLAASDTTVDEDSRLVLRALLHVAVSAHCRRHGDFAGSAEAVRAGLGLLGALRDPMADGGLARTRLVLEQVCFLLDQGKAAEARRCAGDVLAQPPRAASIAPVGWLRLALATRVHLPAGEAEYAGGLLREAAHEGERHGMHSLVAQVWQELSHVEERLRGPGEALACLHRSRTAERAHVQARRTAFAVLTGAFGTGEQVPGDLANMLAAQAKSAPEARRSTDTSGTSGASGTTDTAASERPVGAAPGMAPEPRTAEPASATEFATADQAAGTEQAAAPDQRRRRSARSRAEESRPGTLTNASVDEGRDIVDGPEAPAAPTQRRRRAAEVPAAQEEFPTEPDDAGTRHESADEAETGRSVLDRLGLTGGTAVAGGRRRRPAEDDGAKQANDSLPEPESSDSSPEPAVAEEPAPPVDQPFRLRLPPPLPSLEEIAAERGTPLADPPFEPVPARTEPPQHTGEPAESDSTTEPDRATEPDSTTEPDGAAGDPFPNDELPADAGLADLLARALAEHRAGLSSAAALVRDLGTDDTAPRNGRSHTGQGSASGRHRDPG